MASDEKPESLREKVKGVVNQILPPSEVDLEEIKEEIWCDLAALYYKYEDEDQKRAFREIMYEICDKIREGKWESVYSRLYREVRKEKPF